MREPWVGGGAEAGTGLVAVPGPGDQVSLGVDLLHHRLLLFSCQTRPFS
jgi:hypothetical protein